MSVPDWGIGGNSVIACMMVYVTDTTCYSFLIPVLSVVVMSFAELFDQAL
jgi:hypothetical protein